jgi:DNA-binding transcriptional MerR regulator
MFGLSRSTLLYYDRVGVLAPTGRSRSNYRLYSEADRKRLEEICSFRRAGLSIEDIRTLLSNRTERSTGLLERRLRAIGDEMRSLESQQRLLAGLLRAQAGGGPRGPVDKALFVEMLRAAGMDEAAMHRWHREFESRAPEAHQAFLRSLGIPEGEALRIRRWSLEGAPAAGRRKR